MSSAEETKNRKEDCGINLLVYVVTGINAEVSFFQELMLEYLFLYYYYSFDTKMHGEKWKIITKLKL